MPRTATQPVEWTAALDALLGTVPDARLAAKIGCSGEAVRRRRQRMHVKPFRAEKPWTSASEKLLGAVPDAQLAKRLGVSRVAIRIKRHRLGIAPYAKK